MDTVRHLFAMRTRDASGHFNDAHNEATEADEHAEEHNEKLVSVLHTQNLVVLQLEHAQRREDEGQRRRVHHALQ